MGRTIRYTPESNEEYVKAAQALRFSNASGSHADRRLKRQRTRSAVKLALRKEVRS